MDITPGAKASGSFDLVWSLEMHFVSVYLNRKTKKQGYN